MFPKSRRSFLVVLLVTIMLTAFIAAPVGAATPPPPAPQWGGHMPQPHPVSWDGRDDWGGCGKYVVHFGDTLSAIAHRFDVSVWSLAAENGIRNINHIWAGQRLHIPCGGWDGHQPDGGRPDGGIAYHPSDRPSYGGGWYRVVCGDTVSRIAARHGVSTWWIIDANHLRFPYKIYVGQRLRI